MSTKEEVNPTVQNINQETVQKLSEGLLMLYQPRLKVVRSQLVELTKKQKILEKELHEENIKFTQAQCSDQLHDMVTKVKVYREKLVCIKKDMTSLYERSSKLKKRALKLEQQKQKEALEKVQQREHEEQLIGKASTT